MTTTTASEDSAGFCQSFAVIGMSCDHCEHAITSEVSALTGVTGVTAHAATGTLTIEASRELDIAEIAAAVDDAGYELVR